MALRHVFQRFQDGFVFNAGGHNVCALCAQAFACSIASNPTRERARYSALIQMTLLARIFHPYSEASRPCPPMAFPARICCVFCKFSGSVHSAPNPHCLKGAGDSTDGVQAVLSLAATRHQSAA
jgi:hypothetical protein